MYRLNLTAAVCDQQSEECSLGCIGARHDLTVFHSFSFPSSFFSFFSSFFFSFFYSAGRYTKKKGSDSSLVDLYFNILTLDPDS